MKLKYSIILVAAAMLCHSIMADTPTTSFENPLLVQRTNLPVVIDGNPNDWAWSKVDWIPITKTQNPLDGFSAYFKITYDELNVYVLVKVYDDTPMTEGPTEWQSDNVAVFFSMDINYPGLNGYTEGMSYFRKKAAKSRDEGGISGRTGNNGDTWYIDNIIANSNFQVEQMGYMPYYVEWQLPWNLLTGTANFNHQYFKFDVQVDNVYYDFNNNLNRHMLFWNSAADDQWSTNLNMGYIRMLDTNLSNQENCQLYSDSLRIVRDSLNILKLQLNQLKNDKILLTSSNYQLQQELSQVVTERNIVIDSLSTLYNLLLNEQHIILLSFKEVTTSIDTKQGTVNLHIYPNPARDRMVIECNERVISYSIFTTSGKLISTTTMSASTYSPYELSLPWLSPGLYNLHLQTTAGTIAVLFLKQ